ncbi:MAG: RsmB/NOP family class I SAM-dependent RNA methyltransferase [Chitinophagaceae bacterium]|nr:RsmB/NOP family class I SAM-dependent RNA methyltransferase [Chitinophagaceae bacterium]
MQLPELLLTSLEGLPGYHRESFLQAHAEEKMITAIRLHPFKTCDKLPDSIRKIPWTTQGFLLRERPNFTLDPYFHAGSYYVQEPSSMFLEEALKQCVDLNKPLKVLDLCAAPGGKSTHLQSLISPQSLLVSNEIIRSRAVVLRENIIRWGCENVLVTQNDPRAFSTLTGYFDVLLIDAPCSGSGMFRKWPETIKEWSKPAVTLCSQRQKRIIADAWPSLKKEGVLIYATCSYSKEENEDIVSWILKTFPAEQISLSIPAEWGIIPAGFGYRFWPDRVTGEGFYLCCIRKKEETQPAVKKTKIKLNAPSKHKLPIDSVLNSEGLVAVRRSDEIILYPERLLPDFQFLETYLNGIYSALEAGKIVKNKLIPSHALAMSLRCSDKVPRIAVDLETSLNYLSKKQFRLPDSPKGWVLICYGSQALGWAHVLPQRINNYYPKNLRILSMPD